jgi:hypothetical protein
MVPLDTVKQWLKITTDEFDDQLQDLIDRAQAIIEREVHWYFGTSRDAEEILDGNGTSSMYLRQPPLGDVVISTRSGATDEWTVVLSNTYEVDGRGLHVSSRWARGKRNFKAVYQEGFTEPPGDVAQLLMEMVSSKWKNRGERTDMQSESIGDYSYTRADLKSQTGWSAVKNTWGRKRI